MGLDTSHDCWHGAYSAFMRWREMVADIAGLPPLKLMEGFYYSDTGPLQNPFWEQFVHDKESGWTTGRESIWNRLPIKWECLKPSPLHKLLSHSDCDGELAWQDCGPIADELEKLLPLFPDSDAGGHIGFWKETTSQFIKGLRAASAEKVNVDFH